MLFAKIIKQQGETILEQDKEIKDIKEEKDELKFECEELHRFKERIIRIINNADLTKENYFVTFEKIKKELDASGKSI